MPFRILLQMSVMFVKLPTLAGCWPRELKAWKTLVLASILHPSEWVCHCCYLGYFLNILQKCSYIIGYVRYKSGNCDEDFDSDYTENSRSQLPRINHSLFAGRSGASFELF